MHGHSNIKFVWDISDSKKNSAGYYNKCTYEYICT